MKKKYFTVLLLILVIVISMVAFFGCKPDDVDNPKENTVKNIIVKTKPKQYYLIYDAIDLTGGEILATYNDGTKEIIALTDSRIEVLHAGTGVGDVTNTMRINFGGATVTMPYTVSKIKKIENITIDGRPVQKYSVGGTVDFKNVKLIIKYEGITKPEEIWLTSGNLGKYSESYLKSKQITMVGFNTEKVSRGIINIRYLSTDFYFDYEVVKDAWITDIFILDETVIKTDYFKGETLKLNGAQLVTVKSDGTNKRVNITASMVTGFSTAVNGNYTMYISYPEFRNKTLPVDYKVYQDSDVSSIVPEILNNEANVNVGDNINFVKSNLIININGGGYVKIPLSSSDVILTCEGKPFAETVNTELGRKFVIDVEYKGHTANFTLTVLKQIETMEILNGDSIVTEYTEGELFNFGDAEARVTYDDKTYFTVKLQEQYILSIDKRVIGFKTIVGKSEIDAETFDMTVGEHNKEFYIKVTPNVETEVLGRYYINYTVTAA